MKKFDKAIPLLELLKLEQQQTLNNSQFDMSSGSNIVDTIIGGFRYGELVLVAGRPSMGTTKFLLKSVLEISKSMPVLFCSLDNNNRRVINKLVSIRKDGGKSFFIDHLSKLELTEDFFDEKILVSDKVFNTIEEYILMIANHVRKDNVKVVVIDYFELLPEARTGREIIAVLKEIAEVFNIVLILGGMTNRDYEKKRRDKKPRLKDISVPPSLIPLVDVVLLLYRPEYYGFLQDEYGNSTAGRLEVIIAKNRNIEPFDLKVDCLFYEKTITT